MTRLGWFAFDEEERHDGERVAALEDAADMTDDPAVAATALTEADALRARWNRPRQRFSSIDEIVSELRSIVEDAGIVDIADPDALRELGERAATAGRELEDFGDQLDEQ